MCGFREAQAMDGVIGVEVVPLEHGLLELVEELAHDRGGDGVSGVASGQVRFEAG